MYQTEHSCRECSTPCTASFYDHWPECPRCSRISRDFKPPDLHLAGVWDFPEVDALELSMAWHPISLVEHAHEG